MEDRGKVLSSTASLRLLFFEEYVLKTSLQIPVDSAVEFR
jgi:hypothetical protein